MANANAVLQRERQAVDTALPYHHLSRFVASSSNL